MFDMFCVSKNNEGFSTSDDLFKSLIKSDELKRIIDVTDTSEIEQQFYSFETRIHRLDGEDRDIWVEAGEFVYDDQHNLCLISGIVQDITEKKQAERELRKSENLLQKIFDLLPVGLWIVDKNGKMIRSNKMSTEIWGRDILIGLEELATFQGRKLPSKKEIAPDDWAAMHTIKEGLTIQDEMIEIDDQDGKTKTLLNYSTPILNEKGEMEGAILINLDISQLKKAEEQLSTQLEELRRWNLATLGRENRIRELKTEINEILISQGLPPRYQSAAGDGNE